MADLPEFQVVKGKDARFHLGICRKLVSHVGTTKPTQRKFATWLREVGINERSFLQFLVKLLDIKVGKKVVLGDAGEELFDATRQAAKPVRQTIAGPGQTAPPPPPAEDPFKKAIFDRFVELGGYLCKHVFSDMAEAGGFLSEGEMWQRVQRSGFLGARPTNASFRSWVEWMKFLDCFKPIGFRLKLTEDVGGAAYRYLTELDDDDLIGGHGALGMLAGLGDDEDEADEDPVAAAVKTKGYVTAEELGTADAAAPVPVLPVVAPSATGMGFDDDEDEFDDADFGPQHAAPEVDPSLSAEFGVAHEAVGVLPARALPPASKEDENAPLSEDEEDAIRELFGDEAVDEIRPPEGIGSDALSDTLGKLTQDMAELEGEFDELETEAAVLEEPGTKKPEPEEATAEVEAETEPDPEPEAPAPVPVPAAAAPAVRSKKRRPAAPVKERPAVASPRAAIPDSFPGMGAVVSVGALLASSWEHQDGRCPIGAQDLGLSREELKPGTGPFFLFRLAIAALVFDASGTAAEKLGFLDRLSEARVLENVFFLDWTVDRVLEELKLADPKRPLPPFAERLIQLPRLRRALVDQDPLPSLAGLDPERRAAALDRALGRALGAASPWVEREAARLGLFGP
ncbi:MAG: hypothetical protein ACYS22_00860 [Planctomycetota bacterium]|jgi:hypothetical protein